MRLIDVVIFHEIQRKLDRINKHREPYQRIDYGEAKALVKQWINEMSNMEFLELLSSYLPDNFEP